MRFSNRNRVGSASARNSRSRNKLPGVFGMPLIVQDIFVLTYMIGRYSLQTYSHVRICFPEEQTWPAAISKKWSRASTEKRRAGYGRAETRAAQAKRGRSPAAIRFLRSC